MTRFTVSVVSFTAFRQAKACVAAMLQSTVPFRLILTVQGNPESAAYFTGLAAEFPFIELIVTPNNEGYIEPQKKAFARCESEWFVMTNDDVIVPPDWLEKLAAPFALFPRAALSAPRGGCQTLLPSFHGVVGKAFEYLNGACLCCKTEIVRRHGLFDPELVFAYGDDSSLSLRLRELNYTLHYADFTIRHEIGATSKNVKEVRQHVEANHLYLRRRWAHYLRFRKMDYPILLRRTAAWGDVLLLTPIIRALRKEKPLSPLFVETACAEIFKNNPNVVKAEKKINRPPDMLVINLDGSYEATPGRHIVASYAERAGVAVDDMHTDIYPSPIDVAAAERLVPEGDWVAIHPGPSTWKGKDWPLERFTAVAAAIRAAGMKVVLVGIHVRNIPHDADTRGRLTVQGTAEVIRRCRLFIGIDSLCLHLAESVNTPAIGLFGVTDPQYIITKPETTMGVCGTTPSFGLRHRVVGQNVVDDGGAAMNSITVEMVLDAAMQILKPAVPQITLA